MILGLTGKGVRLVVNDTPVPHGTRAGYNGHKCRCDECKAAQSEYGRKRRGAPKPKKPLPHGTYSGYACHKCRCEDCKKAAAEYRRKGPASPIPHGELSGYTYHKCRCDKCKAASREYLQRKKPRQEPKPLPHGTRRGYSYYNCRCEDCKEALREYGRSQYKPKPKKEKFSKPIEHGTSSGYCYRKCRCEECKAWQSEYSRRYREANPDSRRKYRDANREKVAEYNRSRRADPRYRRLKCDAEQRRQARKRDAFVEDVPRSEIFERDNWQCQIPGCLYPGVPVKLDGRRTDPLYANVDHIVPLAKGGLHERSNLATAHFRCNCVKSDRIEGIAS